MSKNPKISVIIPAYNAEKTLVKCVESLLNQTYENLEIILVDDCSTDGTYALCEQLAEKDTRIRVSHTPVNSGPSQTRNIGMAFATGYWTAFVDSDDWIEPETYQTAVEYAQRCNASLVVWSYISEYGSASKEKHIYDNDLLFAGNSSAQILFDTLGPMGKRLANPEFLHSLSVIWNKLFLTEIIQNNNIVFYDLEEIGIEDLFFSAQYLKHICNRTSIYIDKCFYHYVKIDSSSVSNKYKPTYPRRVQTVISELKKEFCEGQHKDICLAALNNRCALSLINIGLNEITAADGVHKICKRLKKIIADKQLHNALKQLEYSCLPFKWKIFFLCARFKLTFFVFLLLKIMSFLMTRKD